MRKQESLQNGILKELYFNQTQSCPELSERLDRSIPSVSKALNELVKKGLVLDRGFAVSGGGRRPKTYSLPADTQFIVAVAMDQLATRIAMVDMLNNYVTGVETREMELLDNDQALSSLVEAINTFIENTGISREKIIGIGIGMPGFVNNREGVNYTYLPIQDMNLREYLEMSTGLPTWIDNDSSLIALAELRFGYARDRKDTMVVNIGWGIGLGMILNGQIFRGYNGYAGEFSHIPVADDGPLCICGKRGCLQTEASLLVVTEKFIKGKKGGAASGNAKHGKDHLSLMGDAAMKAANKGDQFAIDLVWDTGYRIGKAISILIHIIDPEAIVLSGRGAKVGRILMAAIQNSLNKYCIPRLSAHTEFKISELGYDAELIGAAALVMENLGHHT